MRNHYKRIVRAPVERRDRFRAGDKLIGNQPRCRYAASFELEAVEQTARTTGASISGSCDSNVALTRELLNQFCGRGFGRELFVPPDYVFDVVSFAELLFDEVEENRGMPLVVNENSHSFAR